MKLFLPLLLFILTSTTLLAHANGVSPYLPLKTDPLFELELEKLSTVAKVPLLTKPYHAATIYRYLAKVKDSHPALYQRLKAYIKRYKKAQAVTHFSLQLNHSFKDDMLVANQRGLNVDDAYKITTSSFWQVNEHLILNAGGTFYDGEVVPNNSYISFGWDVFQVDVGYREHWLSPTQEGALLLSTQAKPALNVTISNPALLTDWNIKYEVSIAILEKQNGIQFDREKVPVSGKPALMSLHLSLQPLDWWTIGFNRTLMFAGDDGDISLKDVWNGISDPVNSDNCGGGGTTLQDCSQEFGNQQAAISNKFDITAFNFPLSLTYEYAGEDTKEHKNYQLGNIAQNFGLFIPYLTESLSLNVEYSKFHTEWYAHHIYGEGYANDQIQMGHWWGNLKATNDLASGTATSLRLDWQTQTFAQTTLLYRSATVDSSILADYQRSHEIELKFKKMVKNAFINLTLNFGEDTLGKKFIATSISYIW
ncbi:capsule assembly Wzi family protein [Colwellia sp. C1TZA3]|uniref:capsule assembly Wzi family protein n=1 Tax=Colwellia sp. C1TZA3 TaxID=2508879 RepID=UPI00174CD5A0|nr:capsule assembly Wzi family protein [Colwellia sp. C1TZA3]